MFALYKVACAMYTLVYAAGRPMCNFLPIRLSFF